MKRIFICLFLAIVLAGISVSAAKSVPVQIDGTKLPVSGQLSDGVTSIPLRALAEQNDGSIYWDSARRAAVATWDGHTIIAPIGSGLITVDNENYSGQITLEKGRTIVPLRAVLAACGDTVVWDSYLHGAAITSAGAPYDAQNLFWLSQIISAESQGQPYEGQIAVGNVICNRVENPDYPNSIPGVIFDRKDGVQFEPVGNGSIHLPPTPQAFRAAKDVLDGHVVTPVCQYFFNPKLSTGQWIISNCTYDRTIGSHDFYR